MFLFPFFLIAGIYCLVVHFRNENKAERSLTWPSVQGEIIENKVSRIIGDPDSEEFILKYSYEVQGVKHISKRVRWRFTRASDLKRFPLSTLVNVYYNPEKHSEALLERGPGDGEKGFFGLAMVCFIVCLFIWLFANFSYI